MCLVSPSGSDGSGRSRTAGRGRWPWRTLTTDPCHGRSSDGRAMAWGTTLRVRPGGRCGDQGDRCRRPVRMNVPSVTIRALGWLLDRARWARRGSGTRPYRTARRTAVTKRDECCRCCRRRRRLLTRWASMCWCTHGVVRQTRVLRPCFATPQRASHARLTARNLLTFHGRVDDGELAHQMEEG
jgi:hypothetical protein